MNSATQARFDPSPNGEERIAATLIKRRVIGAAPCIFSPASGFNLRFSPGGCPPDLALVNQIVGAAGQLPVADRRPECRSTGWPSHGPFCRSKRRHHLVPASTGTKMPCDLKLLRNVEYARLKFLGHIAHRLESDASQPRGSPTTRRSPIPKIMW